MLIETILPNGKFDSYWEIPDGHHYVIVNISDNQKDGESLGHTEDYDIQLEIGQYQWQIIEVSSFVVKAGPYTGRTIKTQKHLIVSSTRFTVICKTLGITEEGGGSETEWKEVTVSSLPISEEQLIKTGVKVL